MKKRRIERAIILGLVLSTSIYTSAFAAEQSFSEFTGTADENKNISVTDDTIVNGETEKDTLEGYHVTVEDGVTLDLNNIAGNYIDINGKGDINIKIDKEIKQGFGAIYIGGDIEAKNLTIDTWNTNESKGLYSYGRNINVDVDNLTIKSKDDGIYTTTDGTANVNVNAKTVSITSKDGYGIMNNAQDGFNNNVYMVLDKQDGSNEHINNGSSIYIESDMQAYSSGQARGAILNNTANGTVALSANHIELKAENANGIMNGHGTLTVDSMTDNKITARNGIWGRASETKYFLGRQYQLIEDGDGVANVTAGHDNIIDAKEKAVWATLGDINVKAGNDNTFTVGDTGLYAGNTGVINLEAANNNNITSEKYGIYATKYTGSDTEGTINVTGTDTNIMAKEAAVKVDQGAHVNINTEKTEDEYGINRFYTGVLNEETNVYDGSGLAVDVNNADLDLTKNKSNDYRGAVKAVGTSNVTIGGTGINNIYSTAEVTTQSGNNVTDENGTDVQKQNHIISAVYVQDGANVNITANSNNQNIIATQADTTNDTLASETKERTVWAENGTININGLTDIHASNGSIDDTNSVGVALAAGASRVEGNPEEGTEPFSGVINANLADGSTIYGDMLAGNGGLLNIYKGAGTNSGISTLANGDAANGEPINNAVIQGNALSANGGELNLKLGTGTYWQGRADDYQDANNPDWNQQHTGVFAPEFSNNIESSGNVNVELDGATWEVTGQTWVTSVSGNGGTIDLSATPTDRSTETHAMHIGNLTGNHNFVVNLDKEHSVSDMLYIYNVGEGAGDTNTYTQHVVINDIKGIENIADGEKLRFATVMPGVDNLYFTGEYENGRLPNDTVNGATNGISRARMSAKAATPNVAMFRDAGAMNNSFLIKNENYNASDTENTGYNGTQFDEVKPGDEYIDTNYGEGINWYLQRNKAGDEVSDGGNTIINMSRANYNQAVYLDRLNKRLGEARYINGDEGLWVRMRHDKIDKDTGFEITTNMYELGYDKFKESKDKKGYHRQGVAIDYMDGDTDYKDVNGSGETNRKGIWLYDTWFGNKGHYTDYVLKWGHLENSFEFFTKSRGEKVNGDYNNNVYSLSAEWGYKDIIDEDKENPENNKEKWYIEPQLQLQYARVTGADYTTSQGTDVSLDGINSLIGRAGFRLGKDFGKEKKSTFYIKADILHEFLGDQDISVRDRTTGGQFTDWRYENEGTWYDVGIGFSTMLSDHSYAYLDLEKVFGGDNDDSYQINGGFEWKL